jgi:hypothetical protein
MCDHKNYAILEQNENQTFKLCNDCNAEITETYHERDAKGRITHMVVHIEYPDDTYPEEMLR